MKLVGTLTLSRYCVLISEKLLYSTTYWSGRYRISQPLLFSFLNFFHGLLSQAGYISDPGLISITRWKGGEAPTHLNVIVSWTTHVNRVE